MYKDHFWSWRVHEIHVGTEISVYIRHDRYVIIIELTCR